MVSLCYEPAESVGHEVPVILPVVTALLPG
jgi:hypothetical protein